MIEKKAVQKIKERNYIIKNIIQVIKSCDNFLFISYIDPDALGSMLALGLVLKRLNKNVTFYMPQNSGEKVEYLKNIILFNKIDILKKADDIKNNDFDCIILNDTANKKVIPNFKKFEPYFNNKDIKIIETDHHFGTDSSKISPHSIALFEKANANCEIIGKILFKMDKDCEIRKIIGDSIFKRNIILSLITGIITDTQFGKYLVNKLQYLLIMHFLSFRLELSTLERSDFFRTPHEIYKYLALVSKQNQKCINKLTDYIQKNDKLFLLDISDTGDLENVINIKECKNADIDEIAEILSNKLPELHSKIGALIIDRELEGVKLKQIKIRRSMKYRGFNLKDLEPMFKKVFAHNFLGGGGHEGACSYRIKNILAKNELYIKLNEVFSIISPD